MIDRRAITTQDAPTRLGRELERRERKRQQNRIAQRNYRRNQKERMQALEAAVGSSAHLDPITALSSPPPEKAISAELYVEGVFDGPFVSITPGAVCDQSSSSLSIEDPAWKPEPFPGLMDDQGRGRTALHIAICNGDESMAQLLLERGADFRKQDGSGSTPLHLAAEYGSEDLVRLLLEKSADPNEVDFLGRTALFRAVQDESDRVAKLLLEASVDINVKDSMGCVALHLAVESGLRSLAVLLLQYGADINA